MKKISLVLFIAFSIFFFDIGVLEAGKAEADGGVKGLPPQGLYDDSAPNTRESRTNLDKMAQAGFKLVLNYGVFDYDVADIISYADHANAVGMKVIWDVRAAGDGTFERDYIRERVEAAKTHPATWGYYVADEPGLATLNDIGSERGPVKTLSDYVHQLDPAHPRLLVHWYESDPDDPSRPIINLRPYADYADVIALDVYALTVYAPAEDVGEAARAGQKLADEKGKQWAIVLQSFDAAQYKKELPDAYAGWPDRERMLKERNLALENSHPVFILWYSYFDILRSSDPAGHWADLVAAAFSPAPFGISSLARNASIASEDQDSSQFFPIALICVDDYTPRSPTDPPSKMTVLEEFPEIAKAGFNLLHTVRFDVASPEWGNTDANARLFLDAAHKSGLKVMMGLSYADWPPGKKIPNEQLNLALKRVRALKDHPALYGWVIGDDMPQGGHGEEGQPLEPDPEKLRRIRWAIKEVDPVHPLIVSLPGPVDLDQNYEYRDIADIYMLDYLPIGFEVIPHGIPPEWETHPEDLGKFVDTVHKVIGPEQEVQAHVQIYNLATDPLTWENEQGRMPRELGRYPTRTEMRFMAYNALIHGSPGVGFNCYRYDYMNYGRDDADGREGRDDVSLRGNPSQWRAVASVATELKSMAPIFLAPDSNKKIIVKSETAGIEFLLKDYKDKLYLIAANPSVKKRTATWTMSQPATAINVLSESRPITPKDVSFTDSFDGYGVHCYEISTAVGK